RPACETVRPCRPVRIRLAARPEYRPLGVLAFEGENTGPAGYLSMNTAAWQPSMSFQTSRAGDGIRNLPDGRAGLRRHAAALERVDQPDNLAGGDEPDQPNGI